MWVKYNPNPAGRQVGDCAVRALTKALNIDWETAYALMSNNGFNMCDMPSSDGVWGAVLLLPMVICMIRGTAQMRYLSFTGQRSLKSNGL